VRFYLSLGRVGSRIVRVVKPMCVEDVKMTDTRRATVYARSSSSSSSSVRSPVSTR
jgi:hypothetical protein